jgi:iron complex outermembrane receptor protein
MDPAVAHVDVDDISNIELVKGPYALQYGPGFGGVVNMKTFKPLPRKEFGINVNGMMGYESNWNGFKNRLSVDGGNDKVFFSLSGNMKKYGDYADGNGEEIQSSFERYNYTAQLGVSPFRNNYLIIAYDQSYGKNVMFPALPMDERSDNTRLVSLDYKAVQVSETINEFNAKIYFSDVSHLMDNKQRPFSDTVVAVSDIQARTYGFKFNADFSFGENNFVGGTDYEHILKDGDRTKTRILEPTMPVMTEKLWNDADIQNMGLYLLYNRPLGDFQLDAALRLDLNKARSGELKLVKMGNEVYYNSDVDSDYTNFSFSFGGRYVFSDKFMLRLALGRGVRSPDMNERYIILLPIGYDNYDYLGNPALKPESNHQADLSVKLDLPSAGIIEAGIFFSYITDFITAELVPESIARPQTKGVYGVKRFTNEDHVYLRGFEVSYRSPLENKWGLNASLACTRGVNPEATAYIIEDGQVVGTETVKNDPLPEIPPLEGNIDIYYRFFKGKFIPALNIRMVAKQGFISEAYMESETPGFTLLNFRLSYAINNSLRLTGGVANMLDKAYYEHLNRRIIGGGGNLYEPGRLFYINVYFNI